MIRTPQDVYASETHHSLFKNGRRFQSHADATEPQAPPPGPVQPASAAAALLRMYGPTRALAHALAMKAEQEERSADAVFFDQVARCIERGIVEARQGGAP